MCFICLDAHAHIFISLVMVEEITFLPPKTSLFHCALNPILFWLHKKFSFSGILFPEKSISTYVSFPFAC